MRHLLLRDVNETETLDGRVDQEIITRLEMLKQKNRKNCFEVHLKGNLSDFERSWF